MAEVSNLNRDMSELENMSPYGRATKKLRVLRGWLGEMANDPEQATAARIIEVEDTLASIKAIVGNVPPATMHERLLFNDASTHLSDCESLLKKVKDNL